MPTEADSRIVIDRKLREAGWNIEDANQVATEEPAADGRADYLLLDSRGRPLAVNEAKRFSKDPTTAKVQAEEYARSLKAPFIFLSNGEVIYFWDYENHPERLVENFFTRADLERLVALRHQRRPLKTIPIEKTVRFGSDEREVREYQRKCLEKVDAAIESGKRRLLVEMATGTGKTFTVALMLKRLFQAGRVQRVLFLADRIELARQAKEETFDIYLNDYPSVLLTGGRRSREGQITVGTLPTITSQLGAGGFSSGYFDLVITDECHRSIYSSYKHTLLHFDAIHIWEARKEDCRRAARELLARTFVANPADINIEALAFEAGRLRIEEGGLDGADGRLVADGKTGGKIRVRTGMPQTRFRFTVAHEIGHCCLHAGGLFIDRIDSGKTLGIWNDASEEAVDELAALLDLKLHWEHQDRMVQAVPQTSQFLLRLKLDATLVLLTLWYEFDTAVRDRGETPPVRINAEQLNDSLASKFEPLRKHLPSPTRLREILSQAQRKNLVRFTPDVALERSEIEILPTLKRVIPFQNIEEWNKNAERYLASTKEVAVEEIETDGDADKDE